MLEILSARIDDLEHWYVGTLVLLHFADILDHSAVCLVVFLRSTGFAIEARLVIWVDLKILFKKIVSELAQLFFAEALLQTISSPVIARNSVVTLYVWLRSTRSIYDERLLTKSSSSCAMGSMPTNSNNPPVRTVTLNATVARMLGNNVIYSRYPEFYQFLATDQPTWFVPQPLKGTVFHVNDSTAPPPNHLDISRDIRYEMLDLHYRYDNLKMFVTKQTEKLRELSDVNKKLRTAATKMLNFAHQGEGLNADCLAEEIQRLNMERMGLAAVYENEEDSLTSTFLANITKIPEFHAVDRMMRENQARIKELQSYCIRVKKSYKEQLRRIRSEKVDHESVIEKAQELLINRLINRVSQMTEAKRYFKESIECIYNNEFHDTNLKEALRAVFSPNTDPTDTSTQLDSPNPTNAPTSTSSQAIDGAVVRPDRSALQSSNRTPHAQSSEITLPTFSQSNRQESSHHSSHRNSLQSPADLEGRIYVRVRSARSGELAESNEN
ncbi:hypothetical protein L5515_016612 [Caenorhabditis briggsae]|uniref:Uncharacterized protein n=1 Tax=Caenorhabditis briggsae TaxID=6238 RepID=A0AAE9JPQ5_CAEBR|nr:hypothetical protein L5515_016612 [Caenorhabditis briggsae]